MRGLLVKDFRLLLAQKSVLMTMVMVAVIQLMSADDPEFLTGYVSFIITFLAMGTISYDEFDNGYPFLFTLPISRKVYAASKYVLTLGMSFAGWGIMNVAMMVMGKGTHSIEEFVSTVSILAVLSIIQAVMIPLQLKYGAEKSKIMYLVMIAVIIFLGAAVAKFADRLPDMTGAVEWLATLGPIEIGAAVVLFAVAVNVLSLCISCRIMEKKQF